MDQGGGFVDWPARKGRTIDEATSCAIATQVSHLSYVLIIHRQSVPRFRLQQGLRHGAGWLILHAQRTKGLPWPSREKPTTSSSPAPAARAARSPPASLSPAVTACCCSKRDRPTATPGSISRSALPRLT